MWATCLVLTTSAEPLLDGDGTDRADLASANAGGALWSATAAEFISVVQISGCRTWPRRGASRSASMASKTGCSSPANSNDAQHLGGRRLLLQRLGEFLFQIDDARRSYAVRLRSGRTKTANAAFGSSPPCETRSPRRHSHWSPSVGPSQGSSSSILTEPHGEPALIRSPCRHGRAVGAAR